MIESVIKKRASSNSPGRVTALSADNPPESDKLRTWSNKCSTVNFILGDNTTNVHSNFNINGTRQTDGMREPWMLRTVRIGFVLVLVLYVWSSSGGMVLNVELDAKGGLQRVEGSIRQQEQHKRHMSLLELSQHQSTTDSEHYSREQQDQGTVGKQHASAASSSSSSSSSPQPPLLATNQQDECGMYLAPSTIPGAGLGMFTTHELSAGDSVGSAEVVLPMVELSFFNGDKKELFNPFIHYYWKGQEKALHGIVSEQRSHQVFALVPGMEAAINCNLALINVEMAGSEYDDGNLQRYKDPMVGAFSPYHSTSSHISKDIPAGGELFKFYGDQWFVARQAHFGLIPLSADYPQAQSIVNKYDKLRKKLFPDNAELQNDLWSLTKDFIGKEMWESRIMNALPLNATAAKQAAESGITSLHQPHAIRSVGYLQQHGKCVDNILPGPSSLESKQAGRGAFATRSIKEGTIITGSPLIHVPNKDLFTIFRMEKNQTTAKEKRDDIWMRHVDEIVGYQLPLNYCYGHDASTMLLCPYGPGVNYINHNQTRANVKIQWAQDGMTSHKNAWLWEKKVSDLEFDYNVGLAFDYVATKDIQEGEELFLDYGEAFEDSLTSYLSNWNSSTSEVNYIPAQRYNEQLANAPIRTELEQESDPYPQNLEIRCHSSLITKRKPANTNRHGRWESREFGVPCRILDRYRVETSKTLNDATSEKVVEEIVYKVELAVPLDEVGQQHRSDTLTYVQRKNVDRTSIQFFNRPYTSDLFQPDVFRKEIGIPDALFPRQWRNLEIDFTQADQTVAPSN